MLIILITFWATCAIIHVSKELANPYGRDFWLIDAIFSPYFLASDIYHEWSEWSRINKPKK